jgi:hypothetical protein
MHYLQSPLLAGVANKAVPEAIFFFIGKKSPRRFFQAISFVAAGKRRGFCRLRRATSPLEKSRRGAFFSDITARFELKVG